MALSAKLGLSSGRKCVLPAQGWRSKEHDVTYNKSYILALAEFDSCWHVADPQRENSLLSGHFSGPFIWYPTCRHLCVDFFFFCRELYHGARAGQLAYQFGLCRVHPSCRRVTHAPVPCHADAEPGLHYFPRRGNVENIDMEHAIGASLAHPRGRPGRVTRPFWYSRRDTRCMAAPG